MPACTAGGEGGAHRRERCANRRGRTLAGAARSSARSFANGVHARRRNSTASTSTIREAGDFLSLLGPSGCGKSTALRLIAGLATPTSGVLDWRGERLRAAARNIGFVFQEPTLMPWASVFDNVWLPLRLKGVSRDAAAPAIAEALDAGRPRRLRRRRCRASCRAA